MTAVLDRPAPLAPAAPVPAARPSLGRLGAVALVVGAALNTGQAVLVRAVGSGDTPADKLADVDAHPGLMLAMVLGGTLGVALLLVGLQAVARVVAARSPRLGRAGAVLTFAGTLGFLGLHALMVATYALAGLDDRAAAITVLEHLDQAPVVLALVAPFLLGMFGGVLVLTIGLFRAAGVPRWVPACWAAFLPLDLLAAGAAPVDPHWLFLAGAVGLARAARKS